MAGAAAIVELVTWAPVAGEMIGGRVVDSDSGRGVDEVIVRAFARGHRTAVPAGREADRKRQDESCEKSS